MRVRPAALIVKDGQLLLLSYHYGGVEVHAVPGGSPDNLETLEETLVRELDEELSITISVKELFTVCESVYRERGEIVLHTLFFCEIVSGTPVINPENTSSSGFVWMDIASLPELNMYPNVGKNILESRCLASGREKYKSYIGRINQQWFA